MPDYGHELEFGVFLPPAADQFGETLQLAQSADAAGWTSSALQDHPYNGAVPRHVDAAVGHRRRDRRTCGCSPTSRTCRCARPSVLARSAASLDIITGGRVELGLGAGAFWDAIAAMGGPRRTPGESVDALAEAIEVIRTLWTPGPRREVRRAGTTR